MGDAGYLGRGKYFPPITEPDEKSGNVCPTRK